MKIKNKIIEKKKKKYKNIKCYDVNLPPLMNKNKLYIPDKIYNMCATWHMRQLRH